MRLDRSAVGYAESSSVPLAQWLLEERGGDHTSQRSMQDCSFGGMVLVLWLFEDGGAHVHITETDFTKL